MAAGWNNSKTAFANVSTSEVRIALDDNPDPGKKTNRKLRIQTGEGQIVFFRFGDNTTTLTIPTDATYRQCQPIPPNGFVEIIRAPLGLTHIILKAASGTTPVYISQGEGD